MTDYSKATSPNELIDQMYTHRAKNGRKREYDSLIDANAYDLGWAKWPDLPDSQMRLGPQTSPAWQGYYDHEQDESDREEDSRNEWLDRMEREQ